MIKVVEVAVMVPIQDGAVIGGNVLLQVWQGDFMLGGNMVH